MVSTLSGIHSPSDPLCQLVATEVCVVFHNQTPNPATRMTIHCPMRMHPLPLSTHCWHFPSGITTTQLANEASRTSLLNLVCPVFDFIFFSVFLIFFSNSYTSASWPAHTTATIPTPTAAHQPHVASPSHSDTLLSHGHQGPLYLPCTTGVQPVACTRVCTIPCLIATGHPTDAPLFHSPSPFSLSFPSCFFKVNI